MITIFIQIIFSQFPNNDTYIMIHGYIGLCLSVCIFALIGMHALGTCVKQKKQR